jgi:hypothetical protein
MAIQDLGCSKLWCKNQTFCSKVLALISLGVLRAKDSCESQARYRPLAAGAHEMKRPRIVEVLIRAEC